MNHLPFALTAYLLNAVSVTTNKFLLSSKTVNPLSYLFYISAFSALALLVLPFTHIPRLDTFLIASVSTILWSTGAYLMFKALQIGQVTRVVPVIGTLIPIFLLSNALFTQSLTSTQTAAVLVLVAGLIFLTLNDWQGRLTLREVGFEASSALFFAVSYIVLRLAYQQDDFLTVLIWSRLIIIPLSLLVLVIPKLRSQVFSKDTSQPQFSLLSKLGIIFLVGQAAGGASELLITYSISLANPALVNSLQGSQYVFLFIFGLVLARSYPKIFQGKYTLIDLLAKALGIILIGSGLYLLAT